ncbi:HD domain-containing phosphohydrolase [Acidihalobacter prosperus]
MQEQKNDSILRLVLIGTSAKDIELLEHEIRITGVDFVTQIYFSVDKMLEAVETVKPDLVLVVHTPDINIARLLHKISAVHLKVPVIVVTESLVDLEASALINAGAKGLVRKDRLEMLMPEIDRALKNVDIERSSAEKEPDLGEALDQLKLFRALLDQSADSIEIVEPETLRILDANETAWRSLGFTREELFSLSIPDIDPSVTPKVHKKVLKRVADTGNARYEGFHRRKDGSEFPVEINLKWIEIDKPYILSIARDVSTRKQSEGELLRLNRVLRTLIEGNRAMLRAGNDSQLMRDMCHVITDVGNYLLAWIGLKQENDDKTINPVAISGNGSGYVHGLNLRWDHSPAGCGPVGTAIRTGKVQVVQDIQTHPDFELWRSSAKQYGYASCIALPIKIEGITTGSLNIYSSIADDFDEPNMELLEELTADLSSGLVNIRTRSERDNALKEKQRFTERLQSNMEETIQAVAAVVELRDAYTAGHQRRVADLAAEIASEMGLPKNQVHGIHLAGIVHDIGKIRIPAEILTKPARLSQLEFSFVRTHAQAGYDILKNIAFPWPIAQTVYQHHERLNGSGYPLGLSGENILLEARILSVADVVESMSSHRPYRSGLGIEKALDEIRKNKGVLYDSAVVDACVKLFSNGKYQFKD